MSKIDDLYIDKINTCDNTDHRGEAIDVRMVTLNDEFDNDICYWCKRCRKIDVDMIKKIEPII